MTDLKKKKKKKKMNWHIYVLFVWERFCSQGYCHVISSIWSELPHSVMILSTLSVIWKHKSVVWSTRGSVFFHFLEAFFHQKSYDVEILDFIVCYYVHFPIGFNTADTSLAQKQNSVV